MFRYVFTGLRPVVPFPSSEDRGERMANLMKHLAGSPVMAIFGRKVRAGEMISFAFRYAVLAYKQRFTLYWS